MKGEGILKKFIITLLTVVIIIAIGFVSIKFFINPGDQSKQDEEVVKMEENIGETEQIEKDEMELNTVDDGEVNTENEKAMDPEEIEKAKERLEAENPFSNVHLREITFQNLNDKLVQEIIHYMSHQKVVAEDKWDLIELTDERVNWLLEALDYVELSKEELYRDILTRWKNGDFSKADKDHNAVWKLLGGTTGKATGILTPEEEKQYLEDYLVE
jgi:Family of unknown function (DUF6241)